MTFVLHCSDRTWALKHLKITGSSTFFNHLFKLTVVKHQSSALLIICEYNMSVTGAFLLKKVPVKRKTFPCDDVIMVARDNAWKVNASLLKFPLVLYSTLHGVCWNNNNNNNNKTLFYITMNACSHRQLQWCHNERDDVSNHRCLDCLLNLFSGVDQRKHQTSASLAFVSGIHPWSVNSPRKWPVTLKRLPSDDVIMRILMP